MLLAALAPLLLAAIAGVVMLAARVAARGRRRLSGPREQCRATVLTARSQPCRGTELADGSSASRSRPS